MPYTHPNIPFQPIPDDAAIVRGPQVRFTVLTSRLLRLEYSAENRFEDRPSQVFWYRNQPVPNFACHQDQKTIQIDTGDLRLIYQVTPRGFSRDTLRIEIRSNGATWHFGDFDHQNLRGTGRTLDGADGAIELEQGLLSRNGWALVDDSNSLVFDENGWLQARPDLDRLDLYFFGYGQDYQACLRDYFKLSGNVPLIPRWILGNWWSRYWEYTQAELRDLMLQFRQREVPLSVCIIDMDWHITQTGNRSSGWTGYTWNRALFPDYPGFLKWLRHEMGLRVALNLHPADGVWPHEEMYPEMARRMGLDPQSGQPVDFDIADPEFTRHYFEVLHHPYEAQGVDFWWLDWQQGTRIAHSRHELAKKLDPLWWLNHLHFYDLGRDGKRSFIFSRWGGLGSHRYPIGFSGDSVVSWESLAFQPYFTATAANVGFGWWSHDIGGHMYGIEEPELYARWVQYGVFSPILRLHCTKNSYQDRAPWAFGEDTFRVARAALQLRHALIPYIYSIAWQFSQGGLPLCVPMYHAHPHARDAYECPNQYLFGDQLLAAPFIARRDADTCLSQASIWLPPGNWYGFFDGEPFSGDRWQTVYGTLDEIPVFARAGAIVPLTAHPQLSGADLPDHLLLKIFPGASGAFTLYEDDGQSQAYRQGEYSLIRFSQTWETSHQVFQIEAAQGDTRHLPPHRVFDLHFQSIRQPEVIRVQVNGQAKPVHPVWDAARAELTLAGLSLTPADHLTVELIVASGSLLAQRDWREAKFRHRLRALRLASGVKGQIEGQLPELLANPNRLGAFARHLTASQFAALSDALWNGSTPSF